MSISSAIEQQQNNRPPTIATVIARLQPELARALPKHLDADRMARLALTLVRKDPNLARCSPESFAGALLTAAALGLEVGVGGEAYLVAYKSECTLIVGYQGMAKLYFQHPLAQHLDAQAVYAADKFDYAYGLDPFLTHKPATGDRGDVVAYYAVARLTTGAKAFVVLSPAEVKALRGGNVGPSGRIPDPQRWMERKTALRQLVKLLPKSTQLNRALDVDEHSGRELHADLVAQRRQIETAVVEPAGVDQVTDEVGADYPEDPPPLVNMTTGEVKDPEPPEDPDLIDPRGSQMKALQAGMKDAGMGERVAAIAFLSDVLDRPVESSKTLTRAEAGKVLDELQRMAEGRPFEAQQESAS